MVLPRTHHHDYYITSDSSSRAGGRGEGVRVGQYSSSYALVLLDSGSSTSYRLSSRCTNQVNVRLNSKMQTRRVYLVMSYLV